MKVLLAGDCATLLANAPVYGDSYTWHVDADPLTFPDSPFRSDFGDYANGEPGMPLFVSLLLYLDAAWPREWDAETLFLDGDSDVGILVRPKRCDTGSLACPYAVLHPLSKLPSDYLI